jgi:hypothetical protein
MTKLILSKDVNIVPAAESSPLPENPRPYGRMTSAAETAGRGSYPKALDECRCPQPA